MKLDEYINQMSWKKIILIIIGAFLAVSLLRMILFITVFNQTTNGVKQTISYQKEHLENVRQQFKKADQEAEKITDDTFAHVDAAFDRVQENWHNIHDNKKGKNNG